MKKRGYSLIELLICLGLCISIFCGSIFTINRVKHLYDTIETKHFCKYIIVFVCKCKTYCKSNNTEGNIYFKDDSVEFIENSETVYKLNLPKNITIEPACKAYKFVSIDKKGFTSSAGTIYIINKNRKKEGITIKVATGELNEKKNQ